MHPLDAHANAARPRATSQPGAGREGVPDPNEERRRRLAGQEESILQREVTTLERIIGNLRRGEPRRGEYVVRLGDTAGELADRSNTAARLLDEVIHQARQRRDAAAMRRVRDRQRAHLRESAAWRERAIAAYASLLDGAPPRYRHIDGVLLVLAYHLDASGRGDEARAAWGRLIRELPDSPFLPHAYLAFGEHYFRLGEMRNALTFYEHATRFPVERNPVYGFALYQQAWCLYNLEDFAGSLDRFVRLIDLDRAHRDAPAIRSLARQARRELVLPYARAGRVDRALPFFRRVANDDDRDALQMLEALGEVLQDTGQWAPAMTVWHRLMAEEPASERLCIWQARIVGGTLATAQKPGQLVELERLLDVADTFAGRGDLRAEVQRDCRERGATTAVALAVAWHREAVGTGDQPGTRDRRTMELADRLYGLVETRLPDLGRLALADLDARDRPDPHRIAYYRAELMWAMERYDVCGPAFDRAVELDPAGPHAAESAYGAVLCWERRYQVGRISRGEETRMLASLQRYACLVPGGQDLDVVLYRRARILLDRGEREEAARLFARVVQEHPESAVALPAANLWLEALHQVANTDERRRGACIAQIAGALDPLATRWCATPEAAEEHAELCGTIEPLRCDLIRLDAESLARGGHHRRAAERYLEITAHHSSCPRQDEVLWNAALAFDAAHLRGRAIATWERLVRDHPSSRHATPSARRAGEGYEALALYENASEWYEQFVRRAPQDPAAPDALERAIVFRLGLGDLDRAEAGAALFRRTFGRQHRRDVARVYYGVGIARGRRTTVQEQMGWWARYLREHGADALPHEQVAAQVALARAARAAGDERRAAAHVQAALAQYGDGMAERIAAAATLETPPGQPARAGVGRLAPGMVRRGGGEAAGDPAWAGGRVMIDERARAIGVTRDAISEALFLDAEAKFDAFMAIRLPEYRGGRSVADVGRWATGEFRPWLARREAALREAETAYERIAPLAVPRWQIAAASRIGEMYSTFIGVFRGAPIPRVIEADDELYALYVNELERQAQRFEAPAIERFEFCVRTSTRVRWFDARSRRCEDELHSLDPQGHPVAAELRGQTDWILEVLAQPEIPQVRPMALAPRR